VLDATAPETVAVISPAQSDYRWPIVQGVVVVTAASTTVVPAAQPQGQSKSSP
jgi:hypothetical protein